MVLGIVENVKKGTPPNDWFNLLLHSSLSPINAYPSIHLCHSHCLALAQWSAHHHSKVTSASGPAVRDRHLTLIAGGSQLGSSLTFSPADLFNIYISGQITLLSVHTDKKVH